MQYTWQQCRTMGQRREAVEVWLFLTRNDVSLLSYNCLLMRQKVSNFYLPLMLQTGL